MNSMAEEEVTAAKTATQPIPAIPLLNNTVTNISTTSNEDSSTSTTSEGTTDTTTVVNSGEIVPQTQKNVNSESKSSASSPQQRVISQFIDVEEECIGGYDSDGKLRPFFDANKLEGEQDFDEDTAPINVVTLEEKESTAAEDTPVPYHIPIEDDVLKRMKVVEI